MEDDELREAFKQKLREAGVPVDQELAANPPPDPVESSAPPGGEPVSEPAPVTAEEVAEEPVASDPEQVSPDEGVDSVGAQPVSDQAPSPNRFSFEPDERVQVYDDDGQLVEAVVVGPRDDQHYTVDMPDGERTTYLKSELIPLGQEVEPQ